MTTVTGSNPNSTNRTSPQRRRRVAKVAPPPFPAHPSTSPEPHLAVIAKEDGVDECDVCCEAMPGYVLGDLDKQDGTWLVGHTETCGYCQRMLHKYERLDSVLDQVQMLTTEHLPTPPPFFMPLMPRAMYAQIESPLGPLFVAATDVGVCEVGFGCNQTESVFQHQLKERGFRPVPDAHALVNVSRQLREYFGGMRDHFEVPFDFSGVSLFTQSVLTATTQVPFGHLSTYRDIAQQVGRPSATRAVGNALGRNPIPVIIPCHRIVRSDHSIGGYTGGIEIKERLLSLEGVMLPESST
jgi:methylated-DNA-[protein]-cysteine S-methyltransferase